MLLMAIVEVYALVMLLVAIRMGWYMLVQLDNRQQSDIWIKFLLYNIAWPILLIKPKSLIDPGEIYPDVGID